MILDVIQSKLAFIQTKLTHLDLSHFDFSKHIMLETTFITFFAAAIVTYVIQLFARKTSLSPIRFIDHCFPFREWKTKSVRMDFYVYVIAKIIDKVLLIVPLTIVTVIAVWVSNTINAYFPGHAVYQQSIFWMVVLTFVFFLFADFANYLTHFLQHFVPFLWELHKVHHSATFLTPITTERMHPLGNLFDAIVAFSLVGLPMGVARSMFGLSVADMVLMMFTANMIGTILVLDTLRHSHFPASFGFFDRFLVSPHMHQLHHSYKVEHWDKNFGNKLSIWDWMFGTMVRPRRGEDIPYGLGKAEDHDYDTLSGVYIGPLVKIGRLLRGEPSYLEPGKPKPAPAPFFDRVFWRKPPHLGRAPANKPAVEQGQGYDASVAKGDAR